MMSYSLLWRSSGRAMIMPSLRYRLRFVCMTSSGMYIPTAVAQKSPCEGNRVIMGKISPLKLGQRGPDARQEAPMRTPKRLYAQERLIYQPELLTCPHCGDLLVLCNYLAWDKTVQMLDRVLSVASRTGR